MLSRENSKIHFNGIDFQLIEIKYDIDHMAAAVRKLQHKDLRKVALIKQLEDSQMNCVNTMRNAIVHYTRIEMGTFSRIEDYTRAIQRISSCVKERKNNCVAEFKTQYLDKDVSAAQDRDLFAQLLTLAVGESHIQHLCEEYRKLLTELVEEIYLLRDRLRDITTVSRENIQINHELLEHIENNSQYLPSEEQLLEVYEKWQSLEKEWDSLYDYMKLQSKVNKLLQVEIKGKCDSIEQYGKDLVWDETKKEIDNNLNLSNK